MAGVTGYLMQMLVYTLVLFLCAACASHPYQTDASGSLASSADQSERLIKPGPLPEGPWTSYSRQQNDIAQQMWTANAGADMVRVSVYEGASDSRVELAKSTDDQAGLQKCETFSSSRASPRSEHGYQTITWMSSCQLPDGNERHLLNKVISGHSSLYHVARSWNSRPPNDQLRLWKDYLGGIVLCARNALGDGACADE